MVTTLSEPSIIETWSGVVWDRAISLMLTDALDISNILTWSTEI